MDRRLPAAAVRPVALVLAAVLVALALPAGAEETWTCWSETVDDGSDRPQTVTRCVISGSDEIVTYGSGDSPPVRLSPAVGEDAFGSCWYRTTHPSSWVLLGIGDDGLAVLGYDPDGEPGGPVAIEATFPSCSGEPQELPPPIAEAWLLLAAYEHPSPEPSLDPPPGRGVVGMEVFVGVDVPRRWSDSLVSPQTGREIEVETWVDAVTIDWGDGERSLVPRVAIPLLTGPPDGAEPHAYRTMTCPEPGGDRCHPTLAAYPITVAYRWWARYRVDGGPWLRIDVPDTATTLDYPVGEIVGVLTDVG